ncbi:zinc finger CCCH domain-containing protein 3 isoform X2 [Ambystoma mexicanum]|uniref:zinc finger CCCH domain-containing protein 3 isoform X2 n=1 Tax=Ambystoma mexicanum TaxID=8296 RepID=UPI0037E91797
MAEKESLRRQIELLQGLINKHKNVHGNAPAPLASTAHTWRNPAVPTCNTSGVSYAGPSHRDYQQQQHQQQRLSQQQQLKPLQKQQQRPAQQQQFKPLLQQSRAQIPMHLQQQMPQPQQPRIPPVHPLYRPPHHHQQPQTLTRLQQQHQQQKPLQLLSQEQQHIGNTWRKKYSLVNKPQAPTHPSGNSNAPSTTTRTVIGCNYSQNPDEMVSTLKRPVTVPSLKGASSAINSSVWTRAAIPKDAADGHKTQNDPYEMNHGKLRSRTVLARAQTAGREEQGKSLSRTVLLSPRPTPAEGGEHKKRDLLKQQGESSILSTTSLKATRSGNSATKWTSELCRTRSESALAFSSKVQKPLPTHEPCWTSPVMKQEPPVMSQSHTDTCRLVGNVTKAGPSEKKVPPSSASHVTPPATVVNPLKRRLVTTHNIFSPQRSVTPTPPGKVLKCRKTKYTWVANPARSTRTLRKSVSPKNSDSAKKTPVSTQKTLPSKVSPKGDASGKSKKTTPLPKAGSSSSKYKWKAATSAEPAVPSKSKFKWHAVAQRGRGGSHFSPARSIVLQAPEKSPLCNVNVTKSPFSDSAHPGYKVKSRTKIIRRKSFNGSPTERKRSPMPQEPIKSHYFLRRRTPPKGQTVKKISPKGLVQISRHRLRRLPTPKQQTVPREGCSPCTFRSPASTKVIKTRYKIVKRSAAAAASISPTLLWKARKLSAARWLLLNRMRQMSPSGKSTPLQQQRWKSRGLRCIGGVMYRVSANKLSKHTSPPLRPSDVHSKYFTRSGRLDISPNSTSYCSPSSSSRTPTPSRYIASRAVQRSLAIIRQAKQKKEKKKEYCMYYNRFGKCNRGDSCPYIHDPEKVAVCTRFLRGTCKKTDGTCSFSHKVSKDKMPVCSFFLRGICNNSNCAYSHVYVSKKAEICQDFLKGYCPMGEKCKKKHTLVCPDFAKTGSCPKGAKCKLQHRQPKRPKRQFNSTEASDQERRTPKQLRHGEGPSRGVTRSHEERSIVGTAATTPSNTGSSGLQKLPSFISLKSSPTSPIEEGPTPQREKSGDDTGKPIQIKPRL